MGIQVVDDHTKKPIPEQDVAGSVEVIKGFGEERVFFFADKEAAKQAFSEGKIRLDDGSSVEAVQALLRAVLPDDGPANETDSAWLIRRYQRETIQAAAREAGIDPEEVAKIAKGPQIRASVAKTVRKHMAEKNIAPDRR